jgi:S-DNA-T family DNA segregation ATPase FtsK/SpoIIIE
MALAHGLGGLIRAFSTEKLAAEDRRDGAPFFVFLLSVFGALFAWFLINEPWAEFLNAYSFGLLFGLVAFALPAVFFVYSFYLFRHPASVRDSSRFAIGFWLFLSVVSAFFHIFGDRPTPNRDGALGLATAGGLFGWLIGEPLVSTITIWGAVPILALLGVAASLIMVGVVPNQVIPKLRRFYAFLFGSKTEPEVFDAFDGKKSTWWSKPKDEKPAFETPLVQDIDEFVEAELEAYPDVQAVEVEPHVDQAANLEFLNSEEGVTEPIDLVDSATILVALLEVFKKYLKDFDLCH